MFCYQCEQTAKGEGCTTMGVCGKNSDVAALQDLLIHALTGLSLYAVEGRKAGVIDADVNTFTCEAIFSTLTNVDFDPERFVTLINRCVELRAQLKEKVQAAGVTNVETYVAGAYELPVEDNSVDRAFLITVLSEIPNEARALAELHRVIKPGGTLSITEEFLDPDYLFAFETVQRAEAAGFALVQRSGSFWVYTLNFVKTV